MTTARNSASGETLESIGHQIDGLPFSRWHVRIIGILGLAHLLDAFDATVMAFVLPIFVDLWGLSPEKVGLLISVGYAGQLIGAILLGWLAEIVGRRSSIRIATAILGVMSLVCAAAWGYASMLVFRFIQGIGLGGEVPVVATYVNETTPARFRGRMAGVFQLLFGTGYFVAAGISIIAIPNFGWQSLFIIGGLPLLLAIFLRYLIPESPRWLAAQGRHAEATKAIFMMDRSSLPHKRFSEPYPMTAEEKPVGNEEESAGERRMGITALLSREFRRKTLSAWIIAFCASLVAYGIISWLPTILTTQYGVPLNKAMQYGLITGVFALVSSLANMVMIDFLGRRGCFLIGFGGAMMITSFLAFASGLTVESVVVLASLAMAFVGLPAGAVYVYAPEIYPISLKAAGTGVASSWIRGASIVGPILIGYTLSAFDVGTVYVLFSLTSAVGLLSAWWLAVETRPDRRSALPERANAGP